MKYLHKYDTKAAHDAVYNGSGYQEPWVAYIDDTDEVTYNKFIDYKNIPGSIIYHDGNKLKAISKDRWDSSLGTPVAVVVIPASHMPDGKCRGMSLCNMSYVTPQEGTLGTGDTNASTNGTNLMWGVRGTDVAGLTNYPSIMLSDGQTSTGNWFFPSELYKGMSTIEIIGGGTYPVTVIDNTVDTETAWWYEIGEDGAFDGPFEPPFVISPYASDGSQNPAYLTAGQTLADMDGKANTQVLVNASAIRDTYSSGAFDNTEANYPAAFACHLFSTIGTVQNQWYLPTIGELGYLYTRIKRINESLGVLGTSAVQFGDLTKDRDSLGSWCWSSSESNTNLAWQLGYDGAVNYRDKNRNHDDFRVRAFAAFDI